MATDNLQTRGNPLVVEEDKEVLEPPVYTEEEDRYRSYVLRRMEFARDERDSSHEEFDMMSYLEYYSSNQRGAITFIPPKKNREDVRFATGTTRQALLALLARINSFNLGPEVHAFDKNDQKATIAAEAMGDILQKANELDDNDAKRLLREYELYAQGTVFVEEIWREEFKTKKKLKKKWNGQVEGTEWEEKLEKVFEGNRATVIPGPHVYLGSLKIFEMKRQPFVVTVDVVPYDEAKAMFGKWERWKNVSRDRVSFTSTIQDSTRVLDNWRLVDPPDGEVEIVKYQDRNNNEFNIFLNGVMMMPVGFPLPWAHGEYSIVKQVAEILNVTFPYGGSLVKRLKVSQALENEFWRLMFLKSYQSFQPAMANNTGRTISKRALMPGSITNGLNPAEFTRLMEPGTGVTNSEIQVLRMIREEMNDNSSSDISQGQVPPSGQTATAILQAQKEARILFSAAVFTSAMLEKKIMWLRTNNIVENWFNPIGKEVDKQANDVRKKIKNKFRRVNVKGLINGKGMGDRIVELSDELPNSLGKENEIGSLNEGKELFEEELKLSKEFDTPVRKIMLNPNEFKKMRYTFKIEIVPQEKETSALERVMFDQMMERIQMFGQDVNFEFLQQEFAKIWSKPASKLFKRKQSTSAVQELLGGAGGGAGTPALPPGANGGATPPPGSPPASGQGAAAGVIPAPVPGSSQQPSIATAAGQSV